MTAIGIDLGTTFSCVAVCENERVQIIANDIGERTTPSWVSFTDTQRLIGKPAKDKAATNAKNTVHAIKRLIGRKLTDPSVIEDRKIWTFEVSGTDDKPKIEVIYKKEKIQFSPEEISAMILTKMKKVAEIYLGKPVKDAVVTVPAYFNDSQRQATKDAAKIAGLNLLRTINEPTAAAIAYGYDKKVTSELNILVFDLGGGTLDVSILRIADGIFEVKATSGNTRLGGDDFDNRLVAKLVEQFRQLHGKDASNNGKAMMRLLNKCEVAKQRLSGQIETCLELECFFDGIDFETNISRVFFEEVNNDLFEATIKPVEEALRNAGMRKEEINEIVLVGGSTRIPKIQNLLQEFFNGKRLNQSINPDEAVAYGAAVQAAILSKQTVRKVRILDVTPLSLGTDIQGDTVDVLIKRDTPIPTTQNRTYSTSVDNQSQVLIEVYEGDRLMACDNNLLGRFVLDGIRPAPHGVPKIEVTFDLDVNGILEVSAVEESTGKRSNMTVSIEKGRLSKGEINSMLSVAERMEAEDLENRERIEAKNSLEAFLYHVKRNLDNENVKKRLSISAWRNISNECEAILTWLASSHNADKFEFIDRRKKLEGLWALNE